MEHRVTATEFLILDAAWDVDASLAFLLSRDSGFFDFQYNLMSPPHTQRDRAISLITLLNRRWAVLMDGESPFAGEPLESWIFTARYRDILSMSVKLTRTGGSAWEQLAQPDWSRYMILCGLPPEDTIDLVDDSDLLLLLSAANQQRLCQALDMWRLGSRGDLTIVDHGVDKPWPVTHWRTLPERHWFKLRELPRKDDHPWSMRTEADRHHGNVWRKYGFGKYSCETVVDSIEWHSTVELPDDPSS